MSYSALTRRVLKCYIQQMRYIKFALKCLSLVMAILFGQTIIVLIVTTFKEISNIRLGAMPMMVLYGAFFYGMNRLRLHHFPPPNRTVITRADIHGP